MWLIYSILAACLWGVGQVFTKKGLGEVSPLFNNLISACVVLIVMIPFALINGVQFNLVPSTYLLALLVAITSLYYYYVLGLGQLTLTGTIIATYPLITVVLSLFFLHENPNIYQKLAIIIIITGAILIALPGKLNTLKKINLRTWFWWALFGAFAQGIADFLAKVIINKSDVYTYIFSYALAWISVVILSIFIDKKGRKIPKFNLKKYLPTFAGVTMTTTGVLFFYIAISYGLVSLVTPISSIYTAITVVFAWIFLKEKITKMQILGILLLIAGILLVGIS